jgi:4-hydroxymandelate oxidase
MDRRGALLSGFGLLASAGFTRRGGAEPSGHAPAAELDAAQNLSDFEVLARERMEHSLFAYVAGGAADEITLRRNRRAFDEIRLNPRVLVDVSAIDTSLQLFGNELKSPILLAPAAYQRAVHPEGEIAAAKGGEAAGALFVVSNATTTPLQEIASASKQPFWFQLFPRADRGWIRELVQEAEAAGCAALCLTVDNPVGAIRYREQRHKLQVGPGIMTPHMPRNRGAKEKSESFAADQVKWADVDWLRAYCTVPLLLKGIIDPEDADRAVRLGISGVIVSNHGGRNLDTTPATIEALPRVAERVAGRVPILVDGGIRRGTDIVKALALGAQAILIGRPYLYGLAVGGAAGVSRAVRILRKELEVAMAMMGRPSLGELDRSAIWEIDQRHADHPARD